MRYFIPFILVILCSTAHSQNLNYLDGNPVRIKKLGTVGNEAFLYPDWRMGVVKTTRGATHTAVPLLYDLVDDKLYFQTTTGEAMEAAEPVLEFSLTDSITGVVRTFRSGYTVPLGAKSFSFLEVLADGQLQLLRHNRRIVNEITEYNSSTPKKIYTTENKLYLFADSSLKAIKPKKEIVMEALATFRQQTETCIAAQKLNLKKEDDLVSLISCLNALK